VGGKLQQINIKGTQTRERWENENCPKEGQRDGDKRGNDYKPQTQPENLTNISTINYQNLFCHNTKIPRNRNMRSIKTQVMEIAEDQYSYIA